MIVASSILLLVGGGCTTECKGPACEGAYPLGRVDAVREWPGDRAETTIDDVTTGAVIGAAFSGSDFVAAASNDGALWVGQPEASQVIEIAPPEGDVPENNASRLLERSAERFGAAVSQVGINVYVGAPGSQAGRGDIARFPPGEITADLIISGISEGDQFGANISRCPDITGDGRSELVVSAPWLLSGPAEEAVPSLAGGVIYFRSEDLLTSTGEVSATAFGTVWWGSAVGEEAGMAVACDADHDGDGINDILIGAPHGASQKGRVYMISGARIPSSGSLADQADLVIEGADGDNLGAAIASYVRDGLPFVLLGAPGHSAGAGRAYIAQVADQDAGTIQAYGILEPADAINEPYHFGRAVAAGDLDGDGEPELLVGAPDQRAGTAYDVGLLAIFSGTQTWQGRHVLTEAGLRLTDQQPFRRVGKQILVVDTDADGIDELYLPTRTR